MTGLDLVASASAIAAVMFLLDALREVWRGFKCQVGMGGTPVSMPKATAHYGKAAVNIAMAQVALVFSLLLIRQKEMAMYSAIAALVFLALTVFLSWYSRFLEDTEEDGLSGGE